MAAVYDLIPSLNRGRQVLSTCPLFDVDGSPAPSYTALTDWRQLVKAEQCDVFIDEVTGFAGSRESSAMPPQIAHLLNQLRKRDCTVSWTTPNYARADVILREVTQLVTVCNGYLPKYDQETRWAKNRMFRWVSYDAKAYDDFSMNMAEKLKPVASQMFLRTRKRNLHVQARYDTLGFCSLMNHIDDAGRCMECGGKRSAPRCDCASINAERASAPRRSAR